MRDKELIKHVKSTLTGEDITNNVAISAFTHFLYLSPEELEHYAKSPSPKVD